MRMTSEKDNTSSAEGSQQPFSTVGRSCDKAVAQDAEISKPIGCGYLSIGTAFFQ